MGGSQPFVYKVAIVSNELVINDLSEQEHRFWRVAVSITLYAVSYSECSVIFCLPFSFSFDKLSASHSSITHVHLSLAYGSRNTFLS